MNSLTRILFAFVLVSAIIGTAIVFVVGTTPTRLNAPLAHASLSALERRQGTLEEQLGMLAKPSMRTGVGAVGFRTIPHAESANREWIQILLAEVTMIDQVVLVPTIWRDTVKGFRADGFPVKFRVRVGLEADQDGEVVAEYGPQDRLLPRVAPLVISFPPTKASWVKLETTELSPRGWDGKYLLQLSEILVFSGLDNVALRQPVEVSSSDQTGRRLPRHKDYLVDGFVPYLMDAFDGEQSLAYLSSNCLGMTPIITLDLRTPLPISSIHLHATELSDNVPQTLTDDFGIPRLMLVEGATRADFSDAIKLCDYQMRSIYDVGPIIMRRFSKKTCQYVRFVIKEPNVHSEVGEEQARVGFAEIEVLSDGLNVALGAPVDINLDTDTNSRSVKTITDGNNLFGKILPIRDWMGELARRHDLETERPLIAAELRSRYQRQKAIVFRLSWLAGLLGFATACTVLVERTIRQRAVFQTRERIAADLHDELGANLHAIGLLGDLAQATADSPSKLKSVLQRIRDLTERSGAATRYCTNMLESEGLFGDLMEDMKRTANSLLTDLDHNMSIEGECYVRHLKSSIRIDLFLFYKECLTNILRHSHATHVETQLKANVKELVLTITDNGCGLNDSQISRIPGSLSRRARLAGAQVSVGRLAGGGTNITLKLRTKKFGVL